MGGDINFNQDNQGDKDQEEEQDAHTQIILTVHHDILDQTARAIETLGVLAENCPIAFQHQRSALVEKLLDLQSFGHEDIRVACVNALKACIVSANSTGDKQQLKMTVDGIMPILLLRVSKDSIRSPVGRSRPC